MMEDAERKILDLITGEPGYRLVFYKILKLCETPRLISEVEDEIRAFPGMKTAIHSPHILLGWLAKAGGIERIAVAVEERAQEAAEEEIQEKWQTTEAGQKVTEMEAPGKRLLELLSKEPVYSEIFKQVLMFCQAPRKRTEIEELLEGNPVMDKPKVYPMFFIQGLEAAGGLEWVDKHWQTTEAGNEVLK